MPLRTALACVALALPIAFPASAQSTSGHAHAHAPAEAKAAIDVPEAARAAVEVVDGFGDALASADFERVEALLDPAVVILETGGAENSREEYLGHHARSDAKFMAGTHVALSRRTARVDGATAWVASEREMHATREGKPLTLLGTETMVLRDTPSGWRIVHIHWSSRPKK